MRTALLSRLTVLTVHHCQLPKARAQLQFVQALCTNGVNGRLGECALPVTGRRDVCVERCVVDTDSVKLLVSYRSLGTAASNSPQSRLEASSISAEPGGRPQADLDPCNAICSAALWTTVGARLAARTRSPRLRRTIDAHAEPQ